MNRVDLIEAPTVGCQIVDLKEVSNLRMSRGGRLDLDGNPKGYKVAEHIATRVEVNPQMLSTLKNEEYI